MTRRTGAAVVSILLLLFLAACGSGSSGSPSPAAGTGGGGTPEGGQAPAGEAQAPAPGGEASAKENGGSEDSILIAVPSRSLSQLPVYVGVAKGIFQQHGANVRWEEIRSDVAVKALIGDEIDYTTAGSSALRAAASGLAIRLISGGSEKPGWYLVARPEIQSVHDLKGKVIGITAVGSATDLITQSILQQSGLDPKTDVQTIALGNTANNLAGLSSGQIQASLLSPPWDVRAEREGMRRLLFAGDFVRSLQGGLATSQRKLEENPDEVARVLKGWLESVRYTKEHRDEVIPIISEMFEVDAELAGKAYDEMVDLWLDNGGVGRDLLEKELAYWKEETGKEPPPLESIADFAILHRVQEEMGLKPREGDY